MWLCETSLSPSPPAHTCTHAHLVTQRWRGRKGRGGRRSGMGGAATSSTNGCSHSHTASQLRLHMQSQTAREGERRGECEHQMCADHTLCMVCSHHPKSHTLTVTTPCRWHVNRQGGRRGREKRGRRGSSLIPSIAHPAGTHHPSSHLLPPSPPPHLSLFTHHPFTHYHLH